MKADSKCIPKEGSIMEMCSEPIPVPPKMSVKRPRRRVANHDLSDTIQKSRENSLNHQEHLQKQFMLSQQSLATQLSQLQATLAEFTKTVEHIHISDWRRESHQLLRLGQKSIHTLQRFCENMEEPLKVSCGKLESTIAHSVKTLNGTIDSLYSDNFQDLINRAERKIDDAAEMTNEAMVAMRRQFSGLNYILVAFVSLMVVMGFSVYLNAEWPWETHAKASWHRDIGNATINTWSKISNSDQQEILNSLSQIR